MREIGLIVQNVGLEAQQQMPSRFVSCFEVFDGIICHNQVPEGCCGWKLVNGAWVENDANDIQVFTQKMFEVFSCQKMIFFERKLYLTGLQKNSYSTTADPIKLHVRLKKKAIL